MIQGLFVRFTAFCIWVPAVYLTYCLVQEFTSGQSQIIVGLSMLALFICSCCLIHARHAWQRGAKPEAFGSLAVYVLGAGVLLFLELGFWGSTISGSHEAVTRASAAQGGVEMLMKRDRDAVARGAIAETSAELAAKMQVELSRRVAGKVTVGQTTSDCGDTASAHFRMCGDYLQLKAAHAKAEAAERIEKRIWDAGTRVEKTGSLKHDLFAGAQALSSSLGGRAETWAAVLSILFVALLMATRDGMLSIVFAPLPRAAQRVQEASAPVQVSEPVLTVVEAVQPAPEPVQEVSKPRAPRTPPSGGGKGKPEPVVTTYHDIEADEPNVIRFAERPADTRATLPSFASDIFEEAAPPAKHARRTERKHKAMGSSKEWLAECTERADGVVCPAEDAWASYRAWCEADGMKQLPRSKFHNTISARVGSVSAAGKRGYVGLVLLDLVEEKRRAVA